MSLQECIQLVSTSKQRIITLGCLLQKITKTSYSACPQKRKTICKIYVPVSDVFERSGLPQSFFVILIDYRCSPDTRALHRGDL